MPIPEILKQIDAEIVRLKQVRNILAGTPILFLIDEIFSGTNSQDRKAAAESVIDTLLEGGAVGAISTHDLALAELTEDPAKAGILVHMESNNPDDPLDFDYLVKPGVSTRSNAMAIVRMIGISTSRSRTNRHKA
jgi:DNA mismatch repair ATPase MutS